MQSKNCNETVRKEEIAKSLYFFIPTQLNSFDNCVHHYNVETLNLFDSELQLINTKPMIKNKLKELLNESKKFKVLSFFHKNLSFKY